jgi:hypothetical protein
MPRLQTIEYRMDHLRESLYRRFMLRESQLRRMKHVHNSYEELVDKVSKTTAVTDPNEWHHVQVLFIII